MSNIFSYLQNFLSLGRVFLQHIQANALVIQLHALLLSHIQYLHFLKQGVALFDHFCLSYLHKHREKLRIRL